MKLLIVIVMIIVTSAVSINSKCAGEVTKLTPRFSKLYENVNDRKIVQSIKEIVGILKSLVNVKKSCSGSEGVDIQTFKQKIGDCMKGGFELATNAYQSYNEYEEEGFSDILVDSLVEMSHLVEPVITNCWGDDVKSVLGFVLPNQCISVIDDVAKISLQIIEQKERPLLVTKGLINLQKIFKQSKKACPFVESIIPKKSKKDYDDDESENEDSDFSDDDDDMEALFELFE
ncbi:unnamed protein product [Paramecium sonneborni]|uniref:Uncharacterized protein n=1 Tax=Paramecium sonneborni TaxID=65129 RepID=A0A8S1KFU2_9CILI|nr:unnamed protein product [Paramecium sonneborni]